MRKRLVTLARRSDGLLYPAPARVNNKLGENCGRSGTIVQQPHEFRDAQARLAERVQSGTLVVVDLDPDGTWSPWAAVVVLQSSGVAYAHQCAGLGCEERLAEGYLVPLDGLLLDPDAGRLDPLALTAPFHTGPSCKWGTDSSGLERLTELVAGIAFWSRGPNGEVSRRGLLLDRTRDSEVTEGWAPVLTPDGPAVLLWINCD